MTTPHPHADKLIAIAEGKQMQCQDKINESWYSISSDIALSLISKGAASLIRIAHETILVNGVECVKNNLNGGCCFTIDGKTRTTIWFDTFDQRDQAESATIKPFQS